MALYRVAVCGDEADVRAQISADCLEVLSSLGTDAQLSGFSSADELRAELAGGADAFDLYLLDIQMEGTSGLELAQWLYDTGVRNRVIFITGSAEYALSGYSAHPLHYLLKPVGREELEGAMRLALEAREPQPVVFRQGGKTVSLAPGDILYAESRDHGTVIRMNSGERQCMLALTELEKLVPSWMFSRCHKSYMVNLGEVEVVSRTELHLRNGTALPVSRTFYRPFQGALVRYLNRI